MTNGTGPSSISDRPGAIRRVLVTGGAGFIGANLVRALLAHRYHVIVEDDLSTGLREYLPDGPLEFVRGDILDADLARRLAGQADAIVHLAAQTGVARSLADPRRDCAVNVLGTLVALDAARQAGLRRFVFASSNAALGRQAPPATEDKAPLPVSPYGASKLAGEGYCLAYHSTWGLETVVLRFGNVYGPYSSHKDSVVAKFFKDIALHGRLTIDGSGEQTRDLLFVDDLCRAIVIALEQPVAGEVFQIATGAEISIRALADRVQEVARRRADVVWAPPRQGDVPRSVAAIAKAQALLGWRPEVDLEHGLQRTWHWLQEWYAHRLRADPASR